MGLGEAVKRGAKGVRAGAQEARQARRKKYEDEMPQNVDAIRRYLANISLCVTILTVLTVLGILIAMFSAAFN